MHIMQLSEGDEVRTFHGLEGAGVIPDLRSENPWPAFCSCPTVTHVEDTKSKQMLSFT